jgi:flagellin FlaB
MRTLFSGLKRNERGITGLETAIILIAFVVVASVFAYTVLSAGIFSADKSKDAIYSGLEQARSTMELVGPVVAKDTDSDDTIDEIVLIVTNSLDGEPTNLTTTTDADSDSVLSDESTRNHTLIISYIDLTQEVTDVAWTKTAVGKNDSDNLLESGEKFEITVDVSNFSLGVSEEFTLEIKPARGSSMVIERTTPAVIDAVNDLR